MKLQYFEYEVHVVDDAAAPPDLASRSAMTLRITHPSGENHIFYIYPTGLGWNDPAVWSPDIVRLLQESRTVEASSLYHLLKTLVRLNARKILGDRQ
jgi:hypothetical protein